MKPVPVEVNDHEIIEGEEALLQVAMPGELAGKRLDQALSKLFPDISRSSLQQWIREGRVTLDGSVRRQRDPVIGGEAIVIDLPAPQPGDWAAEYIPLNIVYQDKHILVINKPAGMVVHPGAGNERGTLLNGLVYFDTGLANLPRCGIVHRLDKDTSGLLVIARSEAVRQRLIETLQHHSIWRTYTAIVVGTMIAGARIEAPIGRHSRDRKRMTVTANGKPAVTHYRVQQRYRAHTQVRVELETGRTHQIRVHMNHAGFPIVGDPVYGGRLRIPSNATLELKNELQTFKRQALHASQLALSHPVSGEPLQWSAPLPQDMRSLITALQEDARQHGIQNL